MRLSKVEFEVGLWQLNSSIFFFLSNFNILDIVFAKISPVPANCRNIPSHPYYAGSHTVYFLMVLDSQAFQNYVAGFLFSRIKLKYSLCRLRPSQLLPIPKTHRSDQSACCNSQIISNICIMLINTNTIQSTKCITKPTNKPLFLTCKLCILFSWNPQAIG